jgi:hypothetical protein
LQIALTELHLILRLTEIAVPEFLLFVENFLEGNRVAPNQSHAKLQRHKAIAG